MERAIIVRGRLAGPKHIELEEPIADLEGEVEVVVRGVSKSSPARTDVFDLLARLPPGRRTKEDIDAELAAGRGEWEDA